MEVIMHSSIRLT